MMNLEEQVQTAAMSVLFGLFFMFLYAFFNRLFLKQPFLIRLLFEIVLFLSATLLYFYFLFLINGGKLTVYLPLLLLIGVLIFQLYYAKRVLPWYETIYQAMIHHIVTPIRSFFYKIRGIIKLQWNRFRFWLMSRFQKLLVRIRKVKLHGKKQHHKTATLEHKTLDIHCLVWSGFDCDDVRRKDHR